MCRRTRQIVACVIGDRSETTCRLLWQAIPEEYKPCQTYSDFWEAYINVFPEETHHSVGKESGQTNHMERWNNTLRQWNARYHPLQSQQTITCLLSTTESLIIFFKTVISLYHCECF